MEAPPSATHTSSNLLILLGTVAVAATNETFIISSHFVIDADRKERAPTVFLGDRFKEWYGQMEIPPFAGSVLSYWKLSRTCDNDLVVASLGGESKSEASLIELFALMEAQKNGEDGPLLTNDRANIFYIRDAAGLLRPVAVSWAAGGWGVFAVDGASPCSWGKDHRVFARSFCS